MGVRVVEDQELRDFLLAIKEADEDMKNRESKQEQVYNEFEKGLRLLGSSAVEDRLQDDVPETIETL